MPFPEQENNTEPVTKLAGEVVRILFINPDNQYCVIRVLTPERKTETMCGTGINIAVGEYVEGSGQWVEHPEYGRQFKANIIAAVLPESRIGLKRFLASGIIPGIGERTAAAIVDYFGEQTADILTNHPNRLREIPKMGMKKVTAIREAWKKYGERRNGAIFLQGLGISPAYCARLFRRYGDNAAQIVRSNPYKLAQEVDGIGFAKADQIAASLGIQPDSPERLCAGAIYAMETQSQHGHCCCSQDVLLRGISELLKIDETAALTALGIALTKHRLIMDENMVYLPYLLKYECELPRHIKRLATVEKFSGRLMKKLAPRDGMKFSDEQLAAVEAVGASPLVIITGGPGVGKTTVLSEIVRRAKRANLRLALAAPTGRAAKRLSEATGENARTLHRLLGYEPELNEFQFNQDKPLETDILLVDEVSMLDLPLALALFRAVRTGASLVLIGDADQLPSVGPGRVLGDLLEAQEYFAVCRLTKIFRQGSESLIITNAHRVNQGLLPLAGQGGEDGELRDFYWIDQDDPAAAVKVVEKLLKRIPERFGYDPMDEVQILTPMNRSQCGTVSLNQQLQAILNGGNKESLEVGERVFKLDDKVMQTVNNYDKNVFNGDMGIIRYINAKERVIAVKFDNERLIKYTSDEFSELVHAYAVTVHKSQGCEFPVVIITMLSQHYMMLGRNLLYTAMTRAKKLLILIGGRKALEMATANFRAEVRYTGLVQRIKKTALNNAQSSQD
ncbi:MAG: ATP-dependent RecD-like DNA helicase [Lentisphaerae bacterium]|nr:ATP-dependent RecD-like DNA helicase [Lentisphaerota bacterium]